MYRLMLYFLLVLTLSGAILSAAKILPYDPALILTDAFLWAAVCWSSNKLLAKIFKTAANPESSLISGLILASIFGPVSMKPENLLMLVGVAGIAMLSKYVLTFGQSHIFNPAAFGAAAAALVFNQPSSWWVGTAALLPVILIGGILMTQKIRRWHLVIAFLLVYLGLHFLLGDSIGERLNPALLFLTFVMLVEPLTSPQTRKKRIIFGALVAVLLVGFHKLLPLIAFPFELALLGGNIFARLVTKDFRQTLTLVRREDLSPTIAALWFKPTRPFNFLPGQFLEYTLPHLHPDSRGIRRWFTIASAPSEGEILVATRWSDPGSSFKRRLKKLKIGEGVIVSKVAGDFTLPTHSRTKLVFLAGGIGITPFRSMVKHLLDTDQKRDIVLLYGARDKRDLVFKDIFEKAKIKGWLKPIYVVAPLSAELVKKKIPDWPERTIYVSGPEPMVESLEKQLRALGVEDTRLKRDYFPGYNFV